MASYMTNRDNSIKSIISSGFGNYLLFSKNFSIKKNLLNKKLTKIKFTIEKVFA